METMKDSIYEVHLEVTGNCNLSCVYCYNAGVRYKKDELSLEEIRKLVKECEKYDTEVFTLTGGEPFTRKDFFKILDVMKNKKVYILSNAKLLNEKMIKKIRDNYPQVKKFKISLDGFESHNINRKGSDFNKVINSIRLLKKYGYNVVINTVVLETNQYDLEKIYNLLVELKIDRWRVDNPFVLGYYIKNNKIYRPPNPLVYVKTFARIIEKHNKENNPIIFEIFNLYKSQFNIENTIVFDNNIHPCEYRRSLMSIKPNGDIIFCPSLTTPMSNFRKAGYSMIKVFEEESNNSFYKIKVSEIEDCKRCRYKKICGCGCRANSFCDYNNYISRDQSACATFPLWEKYILPICKKEHRDFFNKLINKKGFKPEKKYKMNYDVLKTV